ncbi:MAG: DEAD/DEAH box helicase family protein [Candidatus Omnitrophica bacterium]|nr:DEAD/DEAH box helicase family protein [Candidatus Omnitrophota bacterium]
MNKNLTDYNLKPSYWSDQDDILNEFYIPTLSAAKIYKRITGFFSSNSLAVAAKGIANFIKNDGQMFLITSVILSEEDKRAIEEVLYEQEEKVLQEIENMEEQLMKDHVSMLSWMLKTKKLSIRIAVVPQGIIHQKIGILEDLEGNILSFTGSDNETANGWLYNDETFHVFRSWKGFVEEEHLRHDLEQFNKMWEGKTQRTRIYPISEAFANKIIRIAPKNYADFENLSSNIEEGVLGKKYLDGVAKRDVRPYQLKAIDAWESHECKGMLEMATGTGKTFTSLKIIERLIKKEGRLFLIIVVPYIHLVSQWKKEFIAHFKDQFLMMEAHSGVRMWEKDLNEYAQNFLLRFTDKVVVFTIYDTFSKNKFIDLVEKYLNNHENLMIVADEVHHLGSSSNQNCMRDFFKFRLGLSATPDRWFDEDGSDKLRNYMGGTVFRFSLKEAIPDFLVPYDYYPEVVQMTGDEIEDYIVLARKISKVSKCSTNGSGGDWDNYLRKLLIDRANLIVNNENKKKRFEQIILDLKKSNLIDHLLIYCSPEQIKWVSQLLNKHNILQRKITFEETQDERSKILDAFEKGFYKALIAIRCLDEGVDIPSIKTAIILASSTNPAQYIQRRGRVLRKHHHKDKAIIYDFFVIPAEGAALDPDILRIEQKIISREVRRSKEFFDSATNKDYVLLVLSKIMNQFKVYFE